ncbi:unnamed protein product, partial [Larinioides sclopetarius]
EREKEGVKIAQARLLLFGVGLAAHELDISAFTLQKSPSFLKMTTEPGNQGFQENVWIWKNQAQSLKVLSGQKSA